MTKNALPVLPVSLIVVSDYLTPDGDEELRRAVRAYAQDARGVPAEIILMLPEGHTAEIAAEFDGKPAFSCPSVIVATHDSDESSQLKDAALAYCRMRVMSLLHRGFIERRNRNGQIIHVSNNGALYRRPVLERYRFEADHGPFDGVAMEVATEAVSIHAYEGLGFIWDVRRNKGYQYARMDLLTKGRRSRLALALRAVKTSFKENRQTAQAVGMAFCRWTDWPLFWAMMLLVRIPEFSGALAAGDPAAFKASTHYR